MIEWDGAFRVQSHFSVKNSHSRGLMPVTENLPLRSGRLNPRVSPRLFHHKSLELFGRRSICLAVATTGGLPTSRQFSGGQEPGSNTSQSKKESPPPRELLAQMRKRREFERLQKEKEMEFEITDNGTAVPFWRKRRNLAEQEARQLTKRIVSLGRRKQLDQIFDVLGRARLEGVRVNLITMNAVLAACVNCGNVDKAVEEFNGMVRQGGVGADSITYGTLLKGLGQAKRLDDAFELLESMEAGRAPGRPQLTEVHLNTLINACAEAGEAMRARGVLSRYRIFGQGARPSTFTYNLLIKGYARSDNPLEALKVMEEMRLLNLPLQRLTYNSLILACVRGQDLETALDLLEEMKAESRRLNTFQLLPDVVTYTTLLKALAEDGDLEGVHRLVEEMKGMSTCVIDRVAYTAIIDASIQAGGAEDGLRFMAEMEERAKVEPQLRPRAHVFLALMRALAERGDLEGTQELAGRLVTHSSGQVWPEDRAEADELVMEAAINSGNLKLAKATLGAMSKSQGGRPSFSARGNKVFVRLMAAFNFSLDAYQPVPFLPGVSPRSVIETVMMPFATQRLASPNQTVAEVAKLFLKTDVLPVCNNKQQCIGLLYARNCKKLEDKIKDIMEPPPPTVPCNAPVSQATEIYLSKKVELLSVVEAMQRDFSYGVTNSSFKYGEQYATVVGFVGVQNVFDLGSCRTTGHKKMFTCTVEEM